MFWKWKEFKLSRARDLDLDLWSGHTEYRRAYHSSTSTYIIKFRWGRKKIFFEGHQCGFGQVQSHVTQKLGQIWEIRPDQIYILCSSLIISGHLPAPIVNGGGDRFWKWKEFKLQRALDLDLGSGHTACRRASLIDLYLHTKCHSNPRNFLWTDGRTDGHFPPLILLGRLLEVDLKMTKIGLNYWVRWIEEEEEEYLFRQ